MKDNKQESFLKKCGALPESIVFLAGDASPRRYYRLKKEEGHTAVLMVEPLENTSMPAFIHTAELLLQGGFRVPRIYGEDRENGFLLLEDLGDYTFNRALKNFSPETLYKAAIDVILALYEKTTKGILSSSHIKPYTYEDYKRELTVFIEWYVPYVARIKLSEKAVEDFFSLWQEALSPVVSTPQKTLVLRDYHIDNLLWMEMEKDLHRVGLLDFQDALYGHLAYDLVSLLEDARCDISPDLQKSLYQYFIAKLPTIDHTLFWRDYNIIGAQRSTKILGVFARIAKKKSLFHYLDHLPRVWRWIEQDLKHPEMLDLKAWYDYYIPEGIRMKTTVEVIS